MLIIHYVHDILFQWAQIHLVPPLVKKATDTSSQLIRFISRQLKEVRMFDTSQLNHFFSSTPDNIYDTFKLKSGPYEIVNTKLKPM